VRHYRFFFAKATAAYLCMWLLDWFDLIAMDALVTYMAALVGAYELYRLWRKPAAPRRYRALLRGGWVKATKGTPFSRPLTAFNKSLCILAVKARQSPFWAMGKQAGDAGLCVLALASTASGVFEACRFAVDYCHLKDGTPLSLFLDQFITEYPEPLSPLWAFEYFLPSYVLGWLLGLGGFCLCWTLAPLSNF
jgi:hypothetical protein